MTISKHFFPNVSSRLDLLCSEISFHDWLYKAFKSLLLCRDYLIRWWWKFKHLFHYTKVELCGFVKLLECWQKSFWKWAASIDRNMPSSSLLEQLNGNDNCVCKGNTFCFITLYVPCKAFCQQMCDKNFVFIFVFVSVQKPLLHVGRPRWRWKFPNVNAMANKQYFQAAFWQTNHLAMKTIKRRRPECLRFYPARYHNKKLKVLKARSCLYL